MKRTALAAAITICAVLVLTLSGCDAIMGFFSSLGLRLQSIHIDPQTIEVGENFDLSVIGVYDDGSEELIITDLTWESNKTEVATVTAGTVTAVSPGVAILTVTHEARRATFTDTAEIEVVAARFVVDDFEVDRLAEDFVLIADDASGGSIAVERSTDQYHDSDYSLEVTYDSGAVASWGVGAIYLFQDDPLDLSGFTGVSIWIHPNGVTGALVLTIEDEDGTQLSTAVEPGPTDFSGNVWVEIAHPFSEMSVPTWAEGTVAGLEFTKVTVPQFILSDGAGVVYVDDFTFY
jgi:Big-like domain-containing protein/carbohydrate binding protein with CBM11 domain